MTCQEIKALVEKGAKLIDVRTEQEFAVGNLTHSVNIPLSTFESIGSHITKEDSVLLYCRSGQRSEMAKNYLVSNGYNATNIGGIIHYVGCVE